MDKVIKNQSGSVILYALLVMALITAIGIGISVVMIRELKLTQNIHYATLAYYASESGVEKGLYKIKVARDTQEQLVAMEDIQSYCLPPDPCLDDNAKLSNGATYNNSKTQNITQEFSYNLEQDQTIQVDLYDPDSGNHLPGIKSVAFSWENEETWLEVSYITWSDDSIPTYLEKTSTDRQLFSGFESGVSSFILLDGISARVRARSFFGDARNLKIIAYDCENPFEEGASETCNPVDIQTRIVVNSVGEKDEFNQSLTATVPWRVPIFGLYDYVVFSEGEIEKTEIVGSAIYASGPIQVDADLKDVACSGCTDCLNNRGWLATACTDTIKCNQSPNEVGWCSMENTSGQSSFTLPIPDYIPSNEKMFLSLGLQFPTVKTEQLQVVINHGATSEPTATIAEPGTTDTFSCTVTSPETFDLRTSLGTRTITFKSTGEAGPSNWWNPNYKYRKKITITNNSTSNLSNFQVSYTFDHASLVSAIPSKSRPDGFDIRIVNNSVTEIARALDVDSSWNNSNTKIWFNVTVDASKSVDYYMYYGYSSASDPGYTGDNVFVFYDDFRKDTTLNLAKWVAGIAPNNPTLSFSSTDGLIISKAAVGSDATAYIRTVNKFDFTNKLNVWFYGEKTTAQRYSPSVIVCPNATVVNNYVTDAFDRNALNQENVKLFKTVGGVTSQLFAEGYIVPTWQKHNVITEGRNSLYFYINDIQKYFSDIAALNNGANNYVFISISTRANTTVEGRFRYIIIRRYASPNPTINIGSEETPSSKILIDWYQLTGYKVFADCP